jgi:hypothetical protein
MSLEYSPVRHVERLPTFAGGFRLDIPSAEQFDDETIAAIEAWLEAIGE